MNVFKNLAKKHSVDIEGFDSAKKDYHTCYFQIDKLEYSPDKAGQAFEILCRKFDHILRICASEAKRC